MYICSTVSQIDPKRCKMWWSTRLILTMLTWGWQRVNQRPKCPRTFLMLNWSWSTTLFVSQFTIAAKTHKPVEETWVLITPCLFRMVKENTSTLFCSQWSRTSMDTGLRVFLALEQWEIYHDIKSFEKSLEKTQHDPPRLGQGPVELVQKLRWHRSPNWGCQALPKPLWNGPLHSCEASGVSTFPERAQGWLFK